MELFHIGDLATWTAEYGDDLEEVTFVIISMKDSKNHWADIIIEALTTDGELITLALPDPAVKVISHATQITGW